MSKDQQEQPAKPLEIPIRVLYRPLAGRPKVIKCRVPPNGIINVHGGSHVVPAQALFQWKGRDPWCIVNQGQVQAVSLAGTADVISPQFFNECITNHYASDLAREYRRLDHEDKPDFILYGLFGLVVLLQLIFGIWAILSIGDLHDALLIALSQGGSAPPPSGDVTVVGG